MVYIYVRDVVFNERPTYKDNLVNGVSIKPHHVDNPKVFEFIDFIVKQVTDNWIDTFKDSVDLKEKLKIRLLELTEIPEIEHFDLIDADFISAKPKPPTVEDAFKVIHRYEWGGGRQA